MAGTDGFYMYVDGAPRAERRDETLVTSMLRDLDEKLAESKQHLSRAATKATQLRRHTRSDSYPALAAAFSECPRPSPEARRVATVAIEELHRETRKSEPPA